MIVLRALLLSFAVAATASAQGVKRIDVDVDESRLTDVMSRISQKSGVPIVVDRSVGEETVSVSLAEIPWREAVDVIAKMTRCEVAEDDGVLRVTRLSRITLSLDAPAAVVLATLAAKTGVSVVYPSRLTERVVVDFRATPIATALETVAAAADLAVSHRSGHTVLTRAPVALSKRTLWKAGPGSKKTNIDIGDPPGMTVADICRGLSKQVGHPVIADPALRATVVDVALTGIPWQLVLQAVARRAECEVEQLPGGILYVSQPPRATLQFRDAKVGTVLELLAAYSGKNIVTGPDVKGLVTLDVRELHWRDTLQAIADVGGLHLSDVKPGLILVTARPLASAPRPKRPPLTDAERKPVHVSATNQDLSEVAEAIGRQVGKNILVDPNVEETVTVNLRRVPWRGAVDLLARMTRCEVEERAGGAILLLTQPPAVTIQASGAPAVEFLRLLARYAEVALVAGPGVVDRTLDVVFRRINYGVALRALAEANGLVVTAINETAFAVKLGANTTAPAAAAVLAPTRADPEVYSAYDREVEALLAVLRAAAAEANEKLLAETAERLRRAVRGEAARRATPPKKPAVAEQPPATPEQLAMLEGRVERVFEEITRLAEEREVEALIAQFTELRQLMAEYGERGAEVAKEMLAKWNERLEAFGEVQLSVKLQIYINRGNGHLRALAEAIRDDDDATFAARHAQIKQLAAEMQAEEREVFHRNADALLTRVTALAERAASAAAVRLVSGFLSVTAIIVAPPGADLGDAAIINGRIHVEGDAVLNAKGEKIPDLRVVDIVRSTVRFALGASEFTRELRFE